MVLTLAMLLPTTSIAVWKPRSPETPEYMERSILFLLWWVGLDQAAGAGSGSGSGSGSGVGSVPSTVGSVPPAGGVVPPAGGVSPVGGVTADVGGMSPKAFTRVSGTSQPSTMSNGPSAV